MKTKKYSDITIKELAQKAGVDRKTFYRNFKSKEDVLRFYLDRTCQDYIARLNKVTLITHTPTCHILYMFGTLRLGVVDRI